jgi:drug/metabolite transporter (DMT)-like permease
MSSAVPKEHRLAGQGAILMAAVLWSTSGLFIKLVDWHPVVIAGARSVLAGLFLLVLRVIFPPRKDFKNKPFPFWAAGISYALTMLTFVTANKLTASANAIMLQYSSPVWAALLGWLLVREKPHWEHWGALVLVSAGLLLFFRGSLGSGALLGDGIALLSGLIFGAYSVFMRMLKDGNPRDAMLLACVISAAISVPFTIFYPPSLSASAVWPVLYMGVLQIGAASMLFSYGIKRISAVQAMLTAIIEPILNPLWVLLATGEKPSLSAVTGGAVIIAAVVASSLIGKRRKDRKFNSVKTGR